MNRIQLKEYIMNSINNKDHEQITFDSSYYSPNNNELDNCITIFVNRDNRDNTIFYKLLYDDMRQYQEAYNNIDFSENKDDDSLYYALSALQEDLEGGMYECYRGFDENELDTLVEFIYYNFRDLKPR